MLNSLRICGFHIQPHARGLFFEQRNISQFTTNLKRIKHWCYTRKVKYACPYVAIFNLCWFTFDLNLFAFSFKLHDVSKISLTWKQISIKTYLNLFDTSSFFFHLTLLQYFVNLLKFDLILFIHLNLNFQNEISFNLPGASSARVTRLRT